MEAHFELDARLAADCIAIGRLPLSLLLLFNDARYPWFVLVPRRAGVSELYELPHDDLQQLCLESAQLARHMKRAFHADKINVGALGNVVPQLHVHHVARFRSDPAWPGPVWGHSPAQPCDKQRISERVAVASDWFGAQLEVI